MDTNNHYKLVNQNKTKNYSMAKIWSHKYNIASEGMPQKMNRNKRDIKSFVDLLNEETYKDRRKKNLYNVFMDDLQKTVSSREEKHLSNNMKRMLKKIQKNVNYIKKSIMDITKMNGLYLEEKAKKTFFRTHQMNKGTFNDINNKNNSAVDLRAKKTLKKINFRKTQSELHIKDNKENKENKNSNNVKSYEKNKKNEKKDDYTKNFVYVNDNYRRQLNYAFLKYNADQHLENIKFLVQADPSIRDDVDNIIQEVQNDIEWRCDKKHFAKKYFNLKERYNRNRSLKLLKEQEQEKEKEKNKDILPNIRNNKNLKNKGFSKTSKQKTFSRIYNKLNYGMKHNKKEMNKINALKEQSKEEMNHMLDASNEISNFIEDKNISNKIDMFKTDYARQIYGYYQGNDKTKNNNIKVKDRDYFLEEKENIVKKIGNVFSFQIDKNVNEQEKMFKGKIFDEAKKFRKRIIDGKKNALDEFNGYLTTYQIKLPQEKSETNNGLNANQTGL